MRRAPAPEGRLGFIRIERVHQGDQDTTKGSYHINAVDCVTQWEAVASVRTISEAHPLPVIAQMLDQFPFAILGFHADNGSEHVNQRVVKLLDRLRIEFTRSRPRHSNVNGLAETKNGAVVRKLFGYAHIPQHHAAAFNTFCIEFLNPFLNFHRPCLFATDRPDPKKPGRIKRIYRSQDAMTPLDKLASLPNAQALLRPGVSLEHLRTLAQRIDRSACRRGTQRRPLEPLQTPHPQRQQGSPSITPQTPNPTTGYTASTYNRSTLQPPAQSFPPKLIPELESTATRRGNSLSTSRYVHNAPSPAFSGT